MLIALLAVLGVDLIVVVLLLAGVVARSRWVRHQSGAFRGIVRIVDGQVPHLSGKADAATGDGSGTSSSGPRHRSTSAKALAPIDTVMSISKPTRKVRRLGDNPRVVTLTTRTGYLDITVRAEDVVLVAGEFRSPARRLPDRLPDDDVAPDTSSPG